MKPMMIATLAVLFASVVGQVVGAGQGVPGLSIFAAAAFAGAVLRLGWQINKPWWTAGVGVVGPSSAEAQPMMASRNALMIALGYAWGGLSMLAVYLLTPLRWQHGWQYGAGMVIIGALVWMVSRRMATLQARADTFKRLMVVSFVHGGAATVALGWLIASGKFLSLKNDWAANIVFVSGALVIAGISAMGIRTARKLQEAGAVTPVNVTKVR
jgi:hypothetical protein